MRLPHVGVTAVCDTHGPNLKAAQDLVEKTQGRKPEGYGDHELSYQDLLKRDDLDGVVIVTSWELHIPMTIAAVKAGKYVVTKSVQPRLLTTARNWSMPAKRPVCLACFWKITAISATIRQF